MLPELAPNPAALHPVGDVFTVLDVDDYLDVRSSGWEIFESLGAVWCRSHQVYVAGACVEVLVTVATQFSEKYHWAKTHLPKKVVS